MRIKLVMNWPSRLAQAAARHENHEPVPCPRCSGPLPECICTTRQESVDPHGGILPDATEIRVAMGADICPRCDVELPHCHCTRWRA